MTKRTARKLESSAEEHSIEIPGTKSALLGFVPPHELAPRAAPYVFPEKETAQLALGVKLSMNIMLTGPTGCGKTSLPTAIAARLGRPLIRFNMDGETRVSSLRGMQRPTAKDGVLTLQFCPGDLAIAMEEGYWVVLDEIDAALPSVLFVLQPVLEEVNRSLRIPETGDVVHAHPGFQIFATANTVGYRASSRSRHAGTNPLNAAFLDRFGMVIGVDYPPEKEEYERIRVNVPNCPLPIVDGIARVAQELRGDEKFKVDFSTRRCVQWARLAAELGGFDVMAAADLAVLRKLESATDAKVAHEVISRIFGYSGG